MLFFGMQVSPLQGVFHAGGSLSDALISSQTPSCIRAVLAPKATAWKLLSSSLASQPLATQHLFSSVAALLGSPGQANYAAANAYLDAAAVVQQQQGLAVQSVQWGAWAGAGMAGASTAVRVQRSGMIPLTPQQGLQALHATLRTRQQVSIVSSSKPC